MFMREYVKLREIAGSTVATIPQAVLSASGLTPGDRVLVEAAPPRRIVLTKEGLPVQSTQRLELEIDLLTKKRAAIDSDLRYKERQYGDGMPCDEGMSDPDVAILVMSSLVRDRDVINVSIAEKRLQLYDLNGVTDPANLASVALPEADGRSERSAPGLDRIKEETHAEKILRASASIALAKGTRTLSRKAVRDHLGLSNARWRAGFTAIFQAMRDDHPGGAPNIAPEFADTLHRVGRGDYELTRKGQTVAIKLAKQDSPAS